MYDTFSAEYDQFVNWPARLAFELPFIERQITAAAARPPGVILDAACGTGMHAIALAQRGCQVSGADLSAGMIARARANAAAAQAQARFEIAGFGSLAAVFGAGECDAVLCLGNSLPHILSSTDLAAALADFAACLRPGGVVLIQNRNFDLVLDQRVRWLPPQSYQPAENPGGLDERLFLRSYDFDSDGLITFNIITLRRQQAGGWDQTVASTRLWPQRQAELDAGLRAAGFAPVNHWGSLDGAPFDPRHSENLVIGARKASLLEAAA